MIKVVYQPAVPALFMEGHAQQGTRGSDIVCAAASVLLFTLAHELLRLELKHERELSPGRAVIRTQGQGREQFDCVCTGLMLLAENYPQAVSFTETEENSPAQPGDRAS